MQPSEGGKHHLGLNTGTRPTANKRIEGKLRKTLVRDIKRVWAAKGWRVLDWCTGSSPLRCISLFMLNDETSADGLKQHDEIFCKKIVLTEKIPQWFDESFYSGKTGTPSAFRVCVCERNTRERNRAPLLYLTTQLVFDSCEPTVESGSEARGSAAVHRRLSSRTWADSVLCFLC